MSTFTNQLKQLLIPRKNSAAVPDLNINWRVIEQWAAALLKNLPSGFYKSLTGPGETVTPGNLTQAGDFEVDSDSRPTAFQVLDSTGSEGLAIWRDAFGRQWITTVSGGSAPVAIPLFIETTDLLECQAGTQAIFSCAAGPTIVGGIGVSVQDDSLTGNADVFIGSPTPPSGGNHRVMIQGSSASVHEQLSFWGATGASQQTVTGSKAGNAALASLLTALANYGLIKDSST